MNKGSGKTSYIMMISSMLIFSTIGIFRRYIPLTSSLLAFTRGILGAVVLLIFIKLRKGKILKDLSRRTLLLLVLTGAIIGINWILLFESYNEVSVPVATLCYYMQPTFLTLLSPVFFKEKLTAKKGICAIVAVCGMVLISGVFESGLVGSLKGIIFGLSAAVFYTFAVINNKIIEVGDPYSKTMIELFSASLVLLPYLIITKNFNFVELDTKSLIMVLVVGIVHTGFAYAMYFSSMRNLRASSIAILAYIDPVGALILSAVFLNESMSFLGIAGAVLILGSAFISEKK